jgi:hypothetical protein
LNDFFTENKIKSNFFEGIAYGVVGKIWMSRISWN